MLTNELQGVTCLVHGKRTQLGVGGVLMSSEEQKCFWNSLELYSAHPKAPCLVPYRPFTLMPNPQRVSLPLQGRSCGGVQQEHSLLKNAADQEGDSLQQVWPLQGDGVPFVRHLGRLLLQLLQLPFELEQTFRQQREATEAKDKHRPCPTSSTIFLLF